MNREEFKFRLICVKNILNNLHEYYTFLDILNYE